MKRYNNYTHDGFDRKQVEPLDPFRLVFAVLIFFALAVAALSAMAGIF